MGSAVSSTVGSVMCSTVESAISKSMGSSIDKDELTFVFQLIENVVTSTLIFFRNCR